MSNDALNEIDTKNETILKSLLQSSELASSSIESSLSQLAIALQGYRSSLKDYVEYSTEQSKILAKWSKSGNGQSYNLPGVFSNSISVVNSNDMKADNERLKELTPLVNRLKSQTSQYFSILNRYVNEMIKQSRVLSKSSNDIDTYLQQLSEFSDWA